MNKYRIALAALMLAFIITGCGTPNMGGQAKSATDTKPTSIPLKSSNATTSIQSISIGDDSCASRRWLPKNEKTVSSTVATWLEQSTSYTEKIPESQRDYQFGGNIGPSQLHIITSDNHKITVYPAYYIEDKNGSINVHYIQDVLVFNDTGVQICIKSSQLYNWLKNDEWKTEFTLDS